MKVEDAGLAGLKLITPQRIADGRGFFSETYRQNTLAEHGIDQLFVQDNHSLSMPVGMVHGLHFQCPPHTQAKLVRVIRRDILCALAGALSKSLYGQYLVRFLEEERAAHGAA